MVLLRFLNTDLFYYLFKNRLVSSQPSLDGVAFCLGHMTYLCSVTPINSRQVAVTVQKDFWFHLFPLCLPQLRNKHGAHLGFPGLCYVLWSSFNVYGKVFILFDMFTFAFAWAF